MKFVYFIALFFTLSAYGQTSTSVTNTIDSLKKIIKIARHDSTRINALKTWDYLIYMSDAKTDLELTKKIDALSDKNLQKKLNAAERQYFLRAKVFSLNGLGLLEYDQGNYDRAIHYYDQCLKICDHLNDAERKAAVYNNIGLIYQNQDDFNKSLEYFTKSLRLRQQAGDSSLVAESLINVGNALQALKNYAAALKTLERALNIKQKLGDKSSVSSCYNNIGLVFQLLGKFDKALNYFNQSLATKIELNEPWGISVAYFNIGKVYGQQKNYTKAIENCKKSLEYTTLNGFIIEKRNTTQALYEFYTKTGRYKEAYEMYGLFVAACDSVSRDENKKEMIRQEIKYQYEKQALSDSLKHAKAGKLKDEMLATQKAQAFEQAAELKNKRILQYALFGGLALLLIFTLFIYNRFRIAKRQKLIIEQKEMEARMQKHIIEEKQKEIIDSIHYAKRIQMALLPSEKYIRKNIIER